MNLAVTSVRHRMAPHAAAHGTVSEREILRVRIGDPGGASGEGEAAPLPSYDGVSIAEVHAALANCRAELSGVEAAACRSSSVRTELLARCAARTVLPQALAGIDLALWDLAGRLHQRPVHALLGAGSPATVIVNATIASVEGAGAAAEAARAREAGYGTVKLKVGIGDDAARVAAVRAAAGPEMRIRLDANGAWGVKEAIRWLEVLAPAGIELCEEPVHGVEQVAQVARQAPVPVALDESMADPAALSRRVCEAVCLKITRGGITGVLEQARRARELGYGVYLASALDGPAGIAAGLAAAAAVRPDYACGLATLSGFDLPVDRPFPVIGGAITIPERPGLAFGDR